MRESLHVLRRTGGDVGEDGTPKRGGDAAKLAASLQCARLRTRVQEQCIDMCEAALSVQEEAVAAMPALIEREREAAAAARQRATEAVERAAALQSELESRSRADRKREHEVGLAHRRAAETEERVSGLHAKQSESVKAAQRIGSELQAARREKD